VCPLQQPSAMRSMGSVAIIDRKTAVKVFDLITTVILNFLISLTPRRPRDNMPERRNKSPATSAFREKSARLDEKNLFSDAH
jgi:hypothetical protein